MLLDSNITKELALGYTKISHVIWYGFVSTIYKDKIMKQLTPKDTKSPYFNETLFQIKNNLMWILFTLINTCKELIDCISILNLWVTQEHMT